MNMPQVMSTPDIFGRFTSDIKSKENMVDNTLYKEIGNSLGTWFGEI